jgi:hypothetical protein
LLLSPRAPDIFFDDDHYRGYRAVLVRLPVVAPDELDSLLRACDFQAARQKAQALKRSCFIGGDLSTFSATDPESNGQIQFRVFTATLQVTENFQSRAIAQEALRLKMVGEILVWRAARRN